jgi:hypothetical protein
MKVHLFGPVVCPGLDFGVGRQLGVVDRGRGRVDVAFRILDNRGTAVDDGLVGVENVNVCPYPTAEFLVEGR